MKFFISIFMISAIRFVDASPIIISYLKPQIEVEWILEELVQKYQIPREFIHLRYISSEHCEPLPDLHYWHLCLNREGELVEVYGDDFFKLKIIPTLQRKLNE
jgi:hypothetical protein